MSLLCVITLLQISVSYCDNEWSFLFFILSISVTSMIVQTKEEPIHLIFMFFINLFLKNFRTISIKQFKKIE